MSPYNHDAAVAAIAATVRHYSSKNQPFRIAHGSTNTTRPSHSLPTVDISALTHILTIDLSLRTATLEPNVPMDKLVQATLAHGLIPPVVMEFPGITAGGGFAGTAGESSSFRHGYFSDGVREVEIILATGEVATASRGERADLFRGAAGSLGTLGVVTKLVLSLVPARKFVKLEYKPYASTAETIEALRAETENEVNDYVDGILFSPAHGVVMTGTLTDTLPPTETPKTFSRARDPWFYLHVEAKQRGVVTTEYIPLAEYLFRYDRAGFWVGRLAFRYFRFPCNGVTRWLLDDFMHTRMLYRALQGAGSTLDTVVQDLSLPYATAGEFIDWSDEEMGIWPVWLCPLSGTAPPTFHPSFLSADGMPQPMLNIGLWGTLPGGPEAFRRKNRELEGKLAELGGRKVLYSQTYYREKEFWGLYDREWYEGLKEKYGAGGLPSVYDKVKGHDDDSVEDGGAGRALGWWKRLGSVWPLPGVKGIRNAIRGRDYLVHRKPSWTYWDVGEVSVVGEAEVKSPGS